MTKIFTPKFRVAFPQVFEAKGFNGSKPKFSVTMLFDVDEINKDPAEKAKWDALVAAIPAAAISKFGSEPAKYKKPFKKGSDQTNNETGAIYNGFEGMVTLNAASESRPGLVDEDVNPIIEQDKFYGGCYARASINLYAWSHPQSGKGVSAGLQNIQKISDGEQFSGKSKAEDDFGAITTAASTTSANSSVLFDDE